MAEGRSPKDPTPLAICRKPAVAVDRWTTFGRDPCARRVELLLCAASGRDQISRFSFRFRLRPRSFAPAVLCRNAHIRSATLQLLTHETVTCDQCAETGSFDTDHSSWFHDKVRSRTTWACEGVESAVHPNGSKCGDGMPSPANHSSSVCPISSSGLAGSPRS
jgi:hypothetical protein